jgi:long-chain acyl-CoA synthetase
VRWMITGSAPISSEVMNFLKVACSCPIIEGYGQTESTGASFVTSFADSSSGHVGGPTRNTEFKLVDVKEMSYTSKDKDEKGNPQPRGEVCFRGPGVFMGYYKDDDKTAEAIDKDGWLHSGDIAKLNSNGSITLIDRKKNIFKLSHGEYVASEKIENIYVRCKSLTEIFVYGDSLKSFLVAIVVPDQKFIETFASDKNIQGNYPDLLRNKDIINMVLEDMNKQAKAEKLFGFEMVRKIHLEAESFTLKDLLTTTFKLKRHDAKKYYQAILDELYVE